MMNGEERKKKCINIVIRICLTGKGIAGNNKYRRYVGKIL